MKKVVIVGTVATAAVVGIYAWVWYHRREYRQKPKKFMLASKLHKFNYQFALIDLNKIAPETLIYTKELVVPSIYGDYLIFIDKTKALYPLFIKPDGEQIPETYPFGV